MWAFYLRYFLIYFYTIDLAGKTNLNVIYNFLIFRRKHIGIGKSEGFLTTLNITDTDCFN